MESNQVNFIDHSSPGIDLFPEPNRVFSCNVEQHADYLNPIALIDLNLINPNWQGKIPLLSPIEPTIEGLLGDNGNHQTHHYYLGINTICFKVDDNNLVEFMGDFSYFEKSHNPNCKANNEQYEIEHKAYKQKKMQYHLGQTLFYCDKPLFEPEGYQLFIKFGGEACARGNWTGNIHVPLNRLINGDYESPIFPIAEDGSRFYFIASVCGHYFRYSGADQILLFYEPNNKIILYTFDWS